MPGAGDLHVCPSGEVSFTMLSWAKRPGKQTKARSCSCLDRYRASGPACYNLSPSSNQACNPLPSLHLSLCSCIPSVPFSKPAVPGSSWHCPMCQHPQWKRTPAVQSSIQKLSAQPEPLHNSPHLKMCTFKQDKFRLEMISQACGFSVYLWYYKEFFGERNLFLKYFKSGSDPSFLLSFW